MRAAWTVLVAVTTAVALGAVGVAWRNHRAARALAEEAVEARTRDRLTVLARRLVVSGAREAEAITAVLEEQIGEEVAYVAVTRPDGTDVLAAGAAAPPLSAAEASRIAAAGEGSRFSRRSVEVAGEPVTEVATAVGRMARGFGGRPGPRLRREVVEDVLGRGAGRGGRPPVVRIGFRVSPLDDHVRQAGWMVFLAAIAGLLIVTAAVVTARLGLRAQRQREETARRLHLASLGELAATVAHEIRNPLGAIRGYAQLAEEAAGGDAARRAATTIREECARIDRTVDEVLGYARQSLPRRETFDLRAAADEALERRAIAAADRDVRLVRDYGDARVEVSADRDQVIRLLGNLVDNALAASPSGGQVTVRLSGGRREAAIGVEDEGPGVPAGDRDRVFEPFFTRRAGGTGLGLALVRRIAEAHGGTVALRDGTRGGALFEVRLPRG